MNNPGVVDGEDFVFRGNLEPIYSKGYVEFVDLQTLLPKYTGVEDPDFYLVVVDGLDVTDCQRGRNCAPIRALGVGGSDGE